MSALVAGFGCRRGCAAADVAAALERVEAELGRKAERLAAPAFKRDEPGLSALATTRGLPIDWIGSADLTAAQADCTTRSAAAVRHVGLASVAEAAALAAAGAGARLLLARRTHGGVTCALAEGAAV